MSDISTIPTFVIFVRTIEVVTFSPDTVPASPILMTISAKVVKLRSTLWAELLLESVLFTT